MSHVIRIRDVSRHKVYDFGPDERALRVPYDVFIPHGAVRQRGNLVDFLQGDAVSSARFLETQLGDCRPGERVLVRLPPRVEDEWWLCEIESVDGVAAA